MKTFAAFFIFCTTAFAVSAQSTPEKDILGIWKVIAIYDDSSMPFAGLEEAEYNKMVRMIPNSRFVFKEDKHFSFSSSIEDLVIEDAYWKYNAAEKTYVILDWADKDSEKTPLIIVSVLKEKDMTYFVSLDSKMKFLVTKQ